MVAKTAAAAAGVAALIGAAFSGGVGTAAARSVEAPAGCELPLGDVDADDVDGGLVVMLDGSVSSADQPERVDDLVRLVDAETADATLSLSVGSFGGSDDEVRYSRCLDGTLFVADGNNDRTRERNRPALIDGLFNAMTALEGGYEASDPTSALRAGVRRLESVEGSRVLVIHTDGIATTGCAALPEQVNVHDPELVDRLTQACVDDGQLPAADGIEIVVGGIGRTDTDLDAASVTFLLELTTSLCEATGATCRVDPNLPTDV